MGGFIDWALGHALYAGLIFTLVLCGLGVPIPEEITFLTAGYIGAKHDATIIGLCVCGLIGIMLGDSLPFFLGRHYGMAFLTRSWVSRLVKPHHIEKTRDFFCKRGSKAIFIARFLAGLRMPTFFMAGAMGVPFWTFFCWDMLGGLISCPLSIWVAFTYGEKVAEKFMQDTHIFVFGALGVALVVGLFKWWRLRNNSEANSDIEKKVLDDTAPNATPNEELPKVSVDTLSKEEPALKSKTKTKEEEAAHR